MKDKRLSDSPIPPPPPGHYAPDLDDSELGCSSCMASSTYRLPKTDYRWCASCGALHVDKVGRSVFPSALATLLGVLRMSAFGAGRHT
jgi:hypothetical protein